MPQKLNFKTRKEGRDKVTGRALYIDDLKFEGMLHGVTVRSSCARGLIKKITYLPGVNWNEFTIVTAKDIPGVNEVVILTHDQPFLADTQINHPEEPIVLLAHPDRQTVEKARNLVKIEVDEQPGVFTIEDSLGKKQIVHGTDNILKYFTIKKGDIDSAWAKAKTIVEGTYETGAQEQLYIETNGIIGVHHLTEGVTVWGSMQCPYYIHKGLKYLFDLPDEKIRVIQTETGGGFGGKEEYPTILAGHAALLAMKAKRPVKMIYDRQEDMVATTKRHPSRTKIKSGYDAAGKLIALDIDFALDGGAYVTLSPVVLSRGGIHAAGPYFCENTYVRARALATNTPPHGAFRGFGAPQSIFALERHLDEAAVKMGKTPKEIREINLIRDGEASATGQIIKDHVDMRSLMGNALKMAGYDEKVRKYAEENPKNPFKKRGIGFATFMHGAGFTGSGERNLASIAGVEATSDGRVRVLASSTEIGQGTNTIFSEIASEALRVPYEWIDVVRPDTHLVPNSGPTVASRTVMIVGKLVENASLALKLILIQSGFLKENYTSEDFKNACARYIDEVGPLKHQAQYKQPSHIQWDEVAYKGDAYATYAWACYVADVEVDLVTYETVIHDFVAFQEIGRVMHPILAEGQIEGGVAQAIGYALYEKVVYKDGRMMNGQMTNYIMPTSVDLPPIRVGFEEVPAPYGPRGAKGIGELPMDGAAPAILNAVQNAIGTAVRAIPMTPEDLRKNYAV